MSGNKKKIIDENFKIKLKTDFIDDNDIVLPKMEISGT